MRLEIGIIALVEEALGVPAERRAQFDWLINKPSATHFGEYYPRIINLFEEMGGDREGLSAKADGHLTPMLILLRPTILSLNLTNYNTLQRFVR